MGLQIYETTRAAEIIGIRQAQARSPLKSASGNRRPQLLGPTLSTVCRSVARLPLAPLTPAELTKTAGPELPRTQANDAFWYEPKFIYDAGSTPVMTDSLAETFLRERWAIDVSRKDLGRAPENKAHQQGRPRKTRA